MKRSFTPDQLAAIGIPNEYDADEGQCAERLHEKQVDTRRWVSVQQLIFRAPDDGKAYSVTYMRGLTEHQDGTDPWNYETEIEATEMEQREVTVTRWLPVADAGTEATR